MARVLFWNVQSFGINKIFSTSLARPKGHGGRTLWAAAADRLALITQVLNAAQPDILVVIEAGSGDSSPNDLATQTGGMNGLVFLQNTLNASAALNPLLPVPVWGLVPPLRVGTGGSAETVGVFFRRQTGLDGAATFRYFTGPNIWTGGYAGNSVDPTAPLAPASAAFPSPPPGPAGAGLVDIHAMLVPAGGGGARLIPRAALHNGIPAPAAQRSEDHVAPRTSFLAPPVPPAAAAPVAFGALRPPYMCTFTETNAAGAVTRNLTLFAVHSPPPTAAAYMATLGTVADIVAPLGALETRIVGGDFNLNLLNAMGAPAGAYNVLTTPPNGYSVLLAPTIPGAPPAGTLDQYMGYFATHLRGKRSSAASRFFWSDPGGNQSFYPGYGYVGSNFVATPFYSIDNILVWPLAPAPHNYQTTVMNLVRGTPLTAIAGPLPGGPPTGSAGVAMPSGFAFFLWPPAPNPPPVNNAAAPNYPGAGAARRVTGWANYGKIINTSDHFAVFADI